MNPITMTQLRTMRRGFGLAVSLLVLTLLTGCASVAPWERGTLAQPGMAVEGHPIDSYTDDHVYFSKEAATGGSGVGGGGCGCN